MGLVEEWNARSESIIMGVIGLVVLLIMAAVCRKMENKEPIKLSGKTIGTTLIGIVGALLLGVGMCLIKSKSGKMPHNSLVEAGFFAAGSAGRFSRSGYIRVRGTPTRLMRKYPV